MQLVLASASPARARVLRGAGVTPRIAVSDVDEPAVLAEARPHGVAEAVAVLAAAKARDVARALAEPGLLILGCDSLLELDGQSLGKPATPQVATQRWQQMRGRAATLHTGHHLINTTTGQQAHQVGATVVHFANISDAEIAAYTAQSEPLQVAGAFTIDGLAGPYIERLEGDHHNVLGLSLPLLRGLLKNWGIAWHDLWSTD